VQARFKSSYWWSKSAKGLTKHYTVIKIASCFRQISAQFETLCSDLLGIFKFKDGGFSSSSSEMALCSSPQEFKALVDVKLLIHFLKQIRLDIWVRCVLLNVTCYIICTHVLNAALFHYWCLFKQIIIVLCRCKSWSWRRVENIVQRFLPVGWRSRVVLSK